MNNAQLVLLARMKSLIKRGKRRFANRSDRNFVNDLLELGLSEKEAWLQILYLKPVDYFLDLKPIYFQTNNTLVFKKRINNKTVYIKITLKNYEKDDVCVCLSFHKDIGR